MHNPKVFCIGFQKTGTSTLKAALEILGYRVTGPNFVYEKFSVPSIGRDISETLKDFDAFQDSPWPLLYRYIAKTDPNAKFILTLRDSDKWLKSVIEHFGGKWTPLRQATYGFGDPLICPNIYKRRFERHNKSVVEYFSDQQDRLLVLQVEELTDWTKLCRFLEKDIPSEAFPIANTKQQRLQFARSLRGRASHVKHWMKLLWLRA